MPLVVSSPISLKRIHLFEEYSQNVTLGNANGTPVNTLLNTHVETLDGTELNFISVSRKNVSLDVNHVYMDMELCLFLYYIWVISG